MTPDVRSMRALSPTSRGPDMVSMTGSVVGDGVGGHQRVLESKA